MLVSYVIQHKNYFRDKGGNENENKSLIDRFYRTFV